jgi:hypothetical protein
VREAQKLRPVRHQRVESVRQRDGGADGDVVRIALDAAQLGDTSDVEHLREIAVLLGDPQSHIGASGHDLGFGVLTAQRQQLSAGRLGSCRSNLDRNRHFPIVEWS